VSRESSIEKAVGGGHPHRVVEGGHLLSLFGTVFEGFRGAEFLHRQGGPGIQRRSGIGQRGAAVIHAELAVGGGVPDVGGVAEHRVVDAHQIEDAANLPLVADGVAVEATDEVDFFVGGARFAVPEVLQNALQRIVVAGDVAADEGWGVGVGHVEIHRYRALLLGVLDEAVEVIANHLGHAGGGDGDHLRLVEVVGVGQAFDHVVEAAEHRRIFGHAGGDAGARLLEVAAEVAAVVGDAALRAMHERQRALKADRNEHRAEWLAGLGRVDGEGLAGKVLLAVFPGLGPFDHSIDPFIRMGVLEVLLLVLEHLLVFRATEQVEVVKYGF
jgi:hypothetical protein